MIYLSLLKPGYLSARTMLTSTPQGLVVRLNRHPPPRRHHRPPRQRPLHRRPRLQMARHAPQQRAATRGDRRRGC